VHGASGFTALDPAVTQLTDVRRINQNTTPAEGYDDLANGVARRSGCGPSAGLVAADIGLGQANRGSTASRRDLSTDNSIRTEWPTRHEPRLLHFRP